MGWSATPIIILKQNITLPDYVLVDFKADSIQRVSLFGVKALYLYFRYILRDYGTN
jgi:hypothetical protein